MAQDEDGPRAAASYRGNNDVLSHGIGQFALFTKPLLIKWQLGFPPCPLTSLSLLFGFPSLIFYPIHLLCMGLHAEE